MRQVAQRRKRSSGRAAAVGAARWVVVLAAAALWFTTGAAALFAQTSPLHDAFDEVERAAAAPDELTVEQPFADDPHDAAAPLRAASQRPAPGGEVLPEPRVEGRLPMVGAGAGDEVQMSQNDKGLITLIVRDKSLSHVLALLAQTQDLNIVASNDIDALISITLRDVPLEEALTAILSVANYTWVQRGNIILITSLTAGSNLAADVQGRQIQVFDLDFAKASVVAEAIGGFLSPIGKVTISESSSSDNRRTREMVVVEDRPESLGRVAAYISQVDCPPRQVLLEAHILQVTLDDTNRQGVDLAALFRVCGNTARIISAPSLNVPFPDPDVRPTLTAPALVATLSGGDLDAVIELLQTTTDSKSLGSPKLLVLNEQQASVHVGESIGYQTSTTTDVSISQAPQFLDVGVTLRIIPRITRDGRVLLHVEPEVSSGEFNPESNAPDKRTSELATDVMLDDGQGMVIGGLIREVDSVTQSKVPFIGDVKGLGWFFRHSTVTKERVEIIFALVPRIQPYDPQWQQYEQGELVRAGVPLLEGPLCRTDRPWDVVLPDGKRVYKPLIPWPKKDPRRLPTVGATADYVVPPYPLPQQRFYDGQCDPGMPAHAEVQPTPAFLSNEAMPLPDDSGSSQYGAEISDQN